MSVSLTNHQMSMSFQKFPDMTLLMVTKYPMGRKFLMMFQGLVSVQLSFKYVNPAVDIDSQSDKRRSIITEVFS